MSKDKNNYYSNKSGTFVLKNGRLYQGRKKVNSLEVRKSGGRLVRSDKDGKILRKTKKS